MTGVRIKLVTIETDSADPEVMRSIRRLLRRALQGQVITQELAVEAPSPAAPSSSRAPVSAAPPVGPAPVPVPKPPVRSEPEQPIAKPLVGTPQRRAEYDIRTHLEGPGAVATPMLEDRILACVKASPGVTTGNLIVALFGNADADARRRVDMVVSNLHMQGKLMRTNGQLFPAGYRGPTAASSPKAAPQQDRGDDETKSRARKLIVARFTADNAYPIHKLAIECFGDNTGSSTRRVRHMLYQLGAHKVLHQIGVDQWRPVTEKAPPEPNDESDLEEDEA